MYCFVFAVAWCAAAVLDLLYYRELLRGAVEAITALEATNKAIKFSTTLENRMGWWGHNAPCVFYGMVLAGLVAGFFLSLYQYRKSPNEEAES